MSIQLKLTFALACLTSTSVIAQTKELYSPQVVTESALSNNLTPELSDAQITKNLYAELEGTFQVIISDPNYQVLYTREMLETIKSSRLPDQNVHINWDQFTSILIFSSESPDDSQNQ